jgi:hypothetical protein
MARFVEPEKRISRKPRVSSQARLATTMRIPAPDRRHNGSDRRKDRVREQIHFRFMAPGGADCGAVSKDRCQRPAVLVALRVIAQM